MLELQLTVLHFKQSISLLRLKKNVFKYDKSMCWGMKPIVLALVESIAKTTAEFLKELNSTLFPFLKPGVNVGKHAHKSSWIN